MLGRRWNGGRIFIGQPSHAWVSGRLARAWGGPAFGRFEPREEVCLAAAQHDIGMTEFDLAPTFNEETGLPHTFLEMPRRLHVKIWSHAARLLLPQSRYAALLVSMHGTGLYEYVDISKEPPETAELVQDYLDEQQRLQRGLIAELKADPLYETVAGEGHLSRNKRLIQIWDLMSLRICMGFESEVVEHVPAADGHLPLFMASNEAGTSVMLDPWPFEGDSFDVVCEGRLLHGRFGSESEMRDALEAAPWVSVTVELHPRSKL